MKNKIREFIKINCLIFCVSTAVLPIYSQTSENSNYTPKINNIPTSPEAALLGRFGDIPISYYTGTANVSIPIYSITDAGIHIPIELRYHGSGIKVDDEATWVGLGWDLSPSGSIIQEVRGKRDELETNTHKLSNQLGYTDFITRFGSLQTGTYNFRHQVGTAYTNCCYNLESNHGYPYYDSEYIIMKLLEGYGEPDIYHFNFAGYSGSFYINPTTGEIVILNKVDEIIFEKVNYEVWQARTLDGNVFRFGTVETAHGGIINEFSGITYKLDYITLSNGKTIDFDYDDENNYKRNKIQNFVLHSNEVFGDEIGQIGRLSGNEIITTHNLKSLSKITTHDAIINFNKEDREDVLNINGILAKRLVSIDIISKINNKKIKTFEFDYDYFPYNLKGVPRNNANQISDLFIATYESVLGKRLKLKSLKEIGYDENENMNTNKPSYLFEYDMSAVMPVKGSYAIDFWGYYNGENNTNLFPDLEYFDYQNDSRYQNLNNPLSYSGYSCSNRYTNNEFAKAYMLTKITYPTGGATKFEYEPNTFNNQFIPDKRKVDAARKMTYLLHNGLGSSSTYSKIFKISKSTTIKFENSIHNGFTPYSNENAPVYLLQNFANSKIVLTKYKILASGQSESTIIKQWEANNILSVEFETNHGKTWIDEIRLEYDPDPTVYYKVNIVNTLNYSSLDTYHIAQIKSDFYYFDDNGVDISQSEQAGLRIKSIKNYSEIGTLISNKKIKYHNGKLLNKFEPLTVYKAQTNHCDFSTLAGASFWDAFLYYFNKIEINTDDFGIEGGTIIGYDEVEEIELASINNNSNNIGKRVFKYFNQANQTKKGLPNIPFSRNGMIKSEEVFNKLGDKIKETLYQYGYLGSTNIFYGIRIRNHSFGNSEICSMVPDLVVYNTTFEPGLDKKFSFYTYPLNAESLKLTRKDTKEYFNDNFVINTELYSYNSLGFIKTITNNTSINSDLQSTELIYANDLPENVIKQALLARNMTGIVLGKKQFLNSELLFEEKTNYALFGSLLLPKEIFYKKANNEFKMKIMYHLYDDKANLLHYTLGNDLQVVILWNQSKTYPIAKIENASYTQVSTIPLNDLQYAMVTTYTHRPLVGVTSIRDPRGYSIYYNYDDFGRLIDVKDNDGYFLTKNEYHYIFQN